MKRCPTAAGESTKLQDRHRGPLVVTEKLPGDVYRVVELDKNKKSRFATTAHVIQLKSWKLHDQDEETEDDRDGEVDDNREEETGDGREEEAEVEPRGGAMGVSGLLGTG
jgi:hypothetical protein